MPASSSSFSLFHFPSEKRNADVCKNWRSAVDGDDPAAGKKWTNVPALIVS